MMPGPSWATVEPAEPVSLPPEVCAPPPAEPMPPDGAGYPEPISTAQIRAAAEADAWLTRHRAWGRRGYELLATARKAGCRAQAD